jgi:glyceraldehyde 3-phosphate dehydrogenase
MGFGRIGKNIFRQAYKREDIKIVAISDLGTPEAMAYLLEYDTIYGRFPDEVALEGKYLRSGTQRARLLKGTVPEDMPWDAYDADVVIESTGVFRHRAELEGHLNAGAKKVILTTPAIDDIDRTVVQGVNDETLNSSDRIVSCASTTTHALGLMIKVLDEAVGIEHAMMTTVHAYSSDQKLSDSVTPNLRRSRSAAENLIPNWTWSPAIVEMMMPHLRGKIDGMAINVPVPNGSNLDLSTQLKRGVTAEEVNAVTIALPGGLVKTITWYDNGWGYASRILDTVCTLGSFMREEVGR